MKMYEMIIDDGKDVYKFCRIGENQEDVMTRFSNNGEFVRVREVTEDFPINSAAVFFALKDKGFGDVECNAVWDLLTRGYANCVGD